jgi:hypothetical protein
MNSDVKDFLAQKGIKHETSAPYTPQQNGRAERLNRIIKERIRVLLFEAEAGPELWPEALATVVYLLNRRAVSGKPSTPIEMFYGRKPQVSHLRIWGCLAYVKVPDRQLNAFAPTSVQGMFIGYERGTKGYRILVGGKTLVSKDVVFIENKKAYPLLRRTSESDVSDQRVEISDVLDGDWNEEYPDLGEVVQEGQHVGTRSDDIDQNMMQILLRAREQLRAEALGNAADVAIHYSSVVLVGY